MAPQHERDSQCERLNTAATNNTITALAYNPDDLHIYASPTATVSMKSILWRCDQDKTDSCHTLDKDVDSQVSSIAYDPDNGHMYLGGRKGFHSEVPPGQGRPM